MLSWVGTGGLFTRLGKLGKLLADANVYQSSTLPTDIQNIIAQYGGNNDEAMIDGIETALTSAQNSAGTILSSLQQYAQQTVNTQVYQDNPLQSNTNLSASLAEVIRQMKADSQTVQACAVTTTVTAASGNTGNGVCVASKYRADGLVQENAFAETITVKCSSDSSTSSSVAGHETFAVTGTVPFSALDWRFPGGSGASTSLTAIDATSDNSNGNLLTNSDYELFTSNVPNKWSVLVGTAGTSIKQSTAQHYSGSSCLNFVGDGSELTSIVQTFGSSASGTAASLKSQTQYAVSLWVKVDSVPAAGVLELSLVDGSNVITTDAAGNNNAFTFNLTGATTSWANVSGVFRTPYILPSTLKIRVGLSTALSAGVNLYVDHLAMGLTTQAYTGGPSVAVFCGSSDFYVPDYFSVAVTNDRGGASNNKTFQTLFDRFFSMRSSGLLLPSSASPSLSDTLIG